MAVLSWYAKTKVSADPEEIELRERLNKEARSVKVFAAAFSNEHRRFDQFTRNLATGKAGFSNTSREWMQIGAISAGMALVNTAVGVMTAAGLIAGFVPVGLALGVSLISIGVNIAVTRMRNANTRRTYQEAVHFMDEKKMHENIHFVQAKIMCRFSNYLNHCSVQEARAFARKTHGVMADAITNGKVSHVHDLVSPKYMALYEKQIPEKKMLNTKNMLSVFARLKMSIENLWNQRKRKEQAVRVNTGFGLFDTRAQPEKKEMRDEHTNHIGSGSIPTRVCR